MTEALVPWHAGITAVKAGAGKAIRDLLKKGVSPLPQPSREPRWTRKRAPEVGVQFLKMAVQNLYSL